MATVHSYKIASIKIEAQYPIYDFFYPSYEGYFFAKNL